MRAALLAPLLSAAAVPAAAAEIDAAALAHLPAADVVVLGEVHDNPVHHANQAAAVAALQPRALVFEMLTPEQAARVTPALRGDAPAMAEALEWEASGWPDFALYHPIFVAAPDAAIYGAAVPRSAARAVIGDGAAAVFGEGAELYGLSLPLPPDEQSRREAEQAEAHCDALPATMLPGMVEIQRLRDAVLARAAVEAVGATDGPAAVITGNGHARTDVGAPAMLKGAAPGLTVLSLGQLEARPDGAPPYDLWLVTAPAEREDPCAVFR